MKRLRALWPAVAICLAIGCEVYLQNLVQFANPLWPVIVRIGPLELPGRLTVTELLQSGQDAAHLARALPVRIALSWFEPFGQPRFDMRHGGFGPLFPLMLLGAAFALRRRARRLAWVALLLTVLSPDPSVPRFVLAFPGVLLALSAATVSEVRLVWRAPLSWAASVLAGLGLITSIPGLAWNLSTWRSVLRVAPEQREQVLGAEGPGDAWNQLREGAAGKVIAYDADFELPYLLWRKNLENRVLRIPEKLDTQALSRWIEEQHLTALVACDRHLAGALVRSDRSRFEPRFRNSTDPCTVYAVASPH